MRPALENLEWKTSWTWPSNLESPCSQSGNWSTAVRFVINSLSWVWSNREPNAAKQKMGKFLKKSSEMWSKMPFLHQPEWWKEVDHSKHIDVFRSPFVLSPEISGSGLEKYKARLAVCIQEEENDNDCFSLVAIYTWIKLLLGLGLPNRLVVRPHDCHKAFHFGNQSAATPVSCQNRPLPNKNEEHYVWMSSAVSIDWKTPHRYISS